MTQIERIIQMEQILDEASAAIHSLTDVHESYARIQAKLDILESYYTSAQWRQDYDDDCAGRLPADLKRGVLSQDAVYDLLQIWDKLKDKQINSPQP